MARLVPYRTSDIARGAFGSEDRTAFHAFPQVDRFMSRGGKSPGRRRSGLVTAMLMRRPGRQILIAGTLASDSKSLRLPLKIPVVAPRCSSDACSLPARLSISPCLLPDNFADLFMDQTRALTLNRRLRVTSVLSLRTAHVRYWRAHWGEEMLCNLPRGLLDGVSHYNNSYHRREEVL